MSGKERRTAPRKDCAVSLRFRVLADGRFAAAEEAVDEFEGAPVQAFRNLATIPGETVNLSERGMYFRSRHLVSVGEPLEMYLTLPRELTGRSPEEVRCRARVVHVENHADKQGLTGVGASIERFEPVASVNKWAN
jgi:hypothetical protein